MQQSGRVLHTNYVYTTIYIYIYIYCFLSVWSIYSLFFWSFSDWSYVVESFFQRNPQILSNFGPPLQRGVHVFGIWNTSWAEQRPHEGTENNREPQKHIPKCRFLKCFDHCFLVECAWCLWRYISIFAIMKDEADRHSMLIGFLPIFARCLKYLPIRSGGLGRQEYLEDLWAHLQQIIHDGSPSTQPLPLTVRAQENSIKLKEAASRAAERLQEQAMKVQNALWVGRSHSGISIFSWYLLRVME